MKNTVKVERAKLNITQEELAKGVNVSRQTINSIETSRYDPSVVLSLKIAKFFKTTVDEIFTLEKND